MFQQLKHLGAERELSDTWWRSELIIVRIMRNFEVIPQDSFRKQP